MNRLMTFDKYRVFETEFAGRPLKVETGKMTQLANGALVRSPAASSRERADLRKRLSSQAV